MRRLLQALLVALVLAPAGGAATVRSGQVLLGRSERGRPIVAFHTGDPRGTRVLVVGCIHGTECAGIAIARALERVHSGLDLWILPNLDPDGYAIGRRQNGRGVDLNANWSSGWRGGGRPWDTYYPGPRPFSERETRIARNLILRIRPRVTVWYHQHMDLVWAWRQSSRAGRIYARAALPEYWIVNTVERCVEVYRDPDAEAGRYRTSERLEPGGVARPVFVPQVAVEVTSLFD